MSLTHQGEWVPDFIIRAPRFCLDLAQIAKNADIPPSFLDDLIISLQLDESFWLSKYLHNQTNGPTLDLPVDTEGQLRYVLGWLTIDCYRITIDKWGKIDPFFGKLSKLINVLNQLDAFKNSNIYQNLRSDTKLKFGNREAVPRGSAPFAELLNRTGMSNCKGIYPQVVLWLLERNYQTYLHSNKTTLLSSQAFDLANILRNLNSPTWEFLSNRIKVQKWDTDYLKFRQTVIHEIFHGHLESQSTDFQNSQKIRNLAQKIDEFRALPIIFLSTSEQPAALIDNSVNLANIQNQIGIEKLELPTPRRHENQTSANKENDKSTSPSDNRKKPTRNQTVLKKPAIIEDEDRKWQRSVEESIWSAANPYINEIVEDFVTKFEHNAGIPEQILMVLANNPNLEKEDIEILAAVVWLQITTSQPLRNLVFTESTFKAQEEWRLNPDLTKLHRTRPQFNPESNAESDHLPTDVVTIQTLDLPQNVVKILSKYRTFKLPILEILSQEIDDSNQSKNIEGNSTKSCETKVPSRRIDRILLGQDLLSKTLQIDHYNWPCHCLRLIHNRKTRNLTEGQLIHIRPNEQRDASTAYYRKDTTSGTNIAGSIHCPSLSQVKKQIDTALLSIESKIKSHDIYEFWNSLTDLAILYLSISTAPRPLLDPFAETINFDLNNHLLILKDKDLDNRNSTRVVPLNSEISLWLKVVYFPLLKELASHTECKKLATMIEVLSNPETTEKQKIPLFFYISPKGIEHIGENWIQKYIKNKSLVSNFARHLSSTYLELADRELNDMLLGHQHLKLPIHGTSSIRVRQRDLDAIRAGTSKHLKAFLPNPLPTVTFPTGALFKGRKYPKSFGEEKRRKERLTKFSKLKRQIESVAADINKLPLGQRTKAAQEALAIIKSTEKYQDSFKALAFHFCECVESVDVDGLQYKSWEVLQEKNPIDAKWMSNLHRRKIIEPALNKLIKDHQNFKSVSDLNLLFSFSLVIFNGITELAIHKKVLEEDYQCFSLADTVNIEFSSEEVDPNFAATRRHQLSQQSVSILQRLKNGRGRGKKTSVAKQKISDDLRNQINQIELVGTDSLSIVEQLIMLERAFQIYHLPTPIAQIASGEIPHRSMDRSSLAAHKQGINIPDITENPAPLIPSQQATQRLDVTISLILELAATLTDQPEEFLIKINQIKCNQAAPLALKEYLIDLFKRRHLGRPLAKSTKTKYLSKLRHFLESTEIIYLIEIQDTDGINEEIVDFLEKLGRKNNEAAEYARHIDAYFNTKALAC